MPVANIPLHGLRSMYLFTLLPVDSLPGDNLWTFLVCLLVPYAGISGVYQEWNAGYHILFSLQHLSIWKYLIYLCVSVLTVCLLPSCSTVSSTSAGPWLRLLYTHAASRPTIHMNPSDLNLAFLNRPENTSFPFWCRQ